ncbi:MAG: hypothetical protein J6U23_09385 [Clostridiales bacterium]|nr:hypothetical protein [Clostridiales bacterium]
MNKKILSVVLALALFLGVYAIIPFHSQDVSARDYSGVYRATTYIYIPIYAESDSERYTYNTYGIRQGDMVVLNSSGCLANCPYADSMVKYINSGALKPVYVSYASGTYYLYKGVKIGLTNIKKK